jgi:hypothetical protein
MSKRLDNMRRNPRGDWKIADVAALCREFDILCQPVSGGGSHYKVWPPTHAEQTHHPFQTPHKTCIFQAACPFR